MKNRSWALAGALLLAGCLAPEENVDPASAAAENATPDDDSRVGICVIGVDSPCNAPEWRDPKYRGTPVEGCSPTSLRVGAVADSPIDAGENVTFRALIEPASAAAACGPLVHWSFGSGQTATGARATYAFSEPGVRLVEATLPTARASTLVGVRLNESFEDTLLLGDTGLCLAAETTCKTFEVDVPEGASVLTFLVETGSDLSVHALSPSGEGVGHGKEGSVENPEPGTWTFRVGGTGANAMFTLNVLANYPGDVI